MTERVITDHKKVMYSEACVPLRQRHPLDRDPIWTETPSGQRPHLDRAPLWTEGQRASLWTETFPSGHRSPGQKPHWTETPFWTETPGQKPPRKEHGPRQEVTPYTQSPRKEHGTKQEVTSSGGSSRYTSWNNNAFQDVYRPLLWPPLDVTSHTHERVLLFTMTDSLIFSFMSMG